MQDNDVANLRAAIAALEGQRHTLGEVVLELAVAPLRARLASLQRPAGLRHRQVAVLFADVVGSTAMAQKLEAEDTLDVLGGALQRMADIVQAHHGRVLRFTGDGVKAAFGMDEAREDDSERAVRAGLAMLAAGREHAAQARRLHGVQDFTVRVGVHTGDVALGAGIESDNTAVGAAVNIAARMEQSAPPGALRISHDTWNHVRGLFEVEPQPPLPIKGVEAPMLTYLVRAALDRHVAGVDRGLQGLNTPMVGRQHELQRLGAAVTRLRESGQLQALTLVGDAGLGKSRLLRELLATLPTGPTECQVLAIRSQPDSALRPWGLLRSLLAVQFDVADTDSAEVARRKIEEGLSPWFDERGERQAQLIGQLSGLDFGDSPHLRGLAPRSLRDQALAALRGYLRALATRGSALTLLLVEDLHWSDDGSLDLLEHLMAHAAELPLVLIMTARPALLIRRPDWGVTTTILPLTPLAAAQSDELAEALLQHIEAVPAALTGLIVGRAEGNPYYMQELVRRLIDDGVIVVGATQWTVLIERLQNLRLPGTLVGLLQARLDALPSDERLAVRQASVIGHVFWDDALHALDAKATQALPALQRAAFVRAMDTSDFEGTAERHFDHHLLHQVIYETLLKAERRLGHSAVARWLTGRTQGRGAEFLAMTGEHAERAGETALAIDCFDQAGREAERRFANAAAQSWTRRAVVLLGESEPLRRFDLLSRLQKVADTLGDRPGQDALHAELAAVLEHHPDDGRLAELSFSLAMLAERRDDGATSERLSREAYVVAERCGAAQWAAMSQANLAWLHFVRQDYEGARQHVDISLQWPDRIENEARRNETRAQLLTVSAMVSTALCRFTEALETLQAVLSLGQRTGLVRLQLGALSGLASAAAALGRWSEVTRWGQEARALADSIGAAASMATAGCHLGQAAMSLNDHAAAIECHQGLLTSMEAHASSHVRAAVLQRIGVSHLELGDAAASLPWLVQAQAVYDSLDEPIEVCLTSAYTALAEARLGQPQAALSKVDRLMDLLDTDMAARPAHQTIEIRWICRRVLADLLDARAEPMLERLFSDVQIRAAEVVDAPDRERLIQALPVFRGIVAAHRERA